MTLIATWNVNSIRARLDHLSKWLQLRQPDLVALQETKVQDADFPGDALLGLGYHSAFAGQKSYNGVAVLARSKLEVLGTGIPGFDDPQRRVLAVAAGDLALLNVYVPNGSAVGSDKYAYKLDWLDALAAWIPALLERYERLLVTGDFNIAPDDRDVHDPQAWRDRILCSEPERERLRRLVALGMTDVFRCFEQPEGAFSWWDYRGGSFRRNQGLRIDLVLASAALVGQVRECGIDRDPRGWNKPSDHAPVTARLA